MAKSEEIRLSTGETKADLSDLSFRSLQIFVAVEETGSMTLAAGRLGASRSAISQQITNLETTVGASLFDRASRPMILTPVGKILRRHAHRILEAVSDAKTELMELSLSSLVELKLGIIDDLDESVTPALAAHLRELYPRCQLTVSSGRSDDLTSALTKRSADIVLTGVLPDGMSHFEDFPILREPFLLVAPKRLIDGAGDIRKQISSLPFVRYNATMPIGQLVDRHLRRLRIDLPAPYSFDASRSIFAMMQECGGWTITTPLCLLDGKQDASEMDCFKLPFSGFGRTIRLVARREELGHLPRRLADLCRELVSARLVPEVDRLAPWLSAGFVVLGNDGEPLKERPASSPAVAGC